MDKPDSSAPNKDWWHSKYEMPVYVFLFQADIVFLLRYVGLLCGVLCDLPQPTTNLSQLSILLLHFLISLLHIRAAWGFLEVDKKQVAGD